MTATPASDPGDLFLKKVLQRDRATGFFLFVGPEGSDLEDRARRFFQAALCRSRTSDEDPCGACSLCVAVSRGGFPDLAVVRLQPGAREIKVADVREALNWLPLKAHYGKKLLLITPAESLNPESGSALLRSLEEPHSEAVIIMAAYREWQILETLRSRATRVRFLGPLKETEKAGVMERFFNRRPALCAASEKDWQEVWVTARSILRGLAASRTPDWAFGLIREPVERIVRDADLKEKELRGKVAPPAFAGAAARLPMGRIALWDLYLQVMAAQALDLYRVENGWAPQYLTPEETAGFVHGHHPNWRGVFSGVHRLRRLLNETNVNPRWMLTAELLRYVRK
jgi:hypothetical protein